MVWHGIASARHDCCGVLTCGGPYRDAQCIVPHSQGWITCKSHSRIAPSVHDQTMNRHWPLLTGLMPSVADIVRRAKGQGLVSIQRDKGERVCVFGTTAPPAGLVSETALQERSFVSHHKGKSFPSRLVGCLLKCMTPTEASGPMEVNVVLFPEHRTLAGSRR